MSEAAVKLRGKFTRCALLIFFYRTSLNSVFSVEHVYIHRAYLYQEIVGKVQYEQLIVFLVTDKHHSLSEFGLASCVEIKNIM